MKYSIIIPCYNSEKTIRDSINSIPNKPSDIEIIAIDDGSSDNTCNIINSLKEEYQNLILISQDNYGAGAARQRGVNIAKGDYILFLDSDDLFYSSAFIYFDNIIEQHPDADIIRFKNSNFSDISEISVFTQAIDSINNNFSFNTNLISIYNRNSFINDVYCNEIVDGTVAVTLWGKLYKRELFSKAVKDYGRNILEDYYINMQYYMYVNNCIDIDAPLYWWRESNNGASHTYHTGTSEMLETVHSYKLSCMKKLDIYTDEQIRRANDWIIRFCCATFYFTKDLSFSERKFEYKKINNILKKYDVYSNLGSSVYLRDTKIFKTKFFLLINLYYCLRWRKK